MKIKYCVLWVAAAFVSVSYGWGFDSALKAVDKATEKVNAVSQAVNGTSARDASIQNTAENTGTASVKYDESRRMAVFSECNSQLNAARAKNEIDARTSYQAILEWLRNDKSTIVDAESERSYREGFAQRLNDAKSAQSKPKDSVKPVPTSNATSQSSGYAAHQAYAAQHTYVSPNQQNTVPQNQSTAPAATGSYSSSKLRDIKQECLQQLNEAKSSGEISETDSIDIDGWLNREIQKVTNAESEKNYRDGFAQKLEEVKSARGAYLEMKKLYQECYAIAMDIGDKGESSKNVNRFFYGNSLGGNDFRGFGPANNGAPVKGKPGSNEQEVALPELTIASAKEFKEGLAKKLSEVAAAKEEENKKREYADSLHPLEHELVCKIDKEIPYNCPEKKKLNNEVKSFFENIDWHGFTNLPTQESVDALKEKVSKTIEGFKAAGEKAEGLRKSLNDDLQLANRLGIMTDQEFNQKHSEMRKFEEEHTLVEFVNEVETYLQTLKAKIAPVAEKIEARNKRLENLRKVVHDNNEAELSKDGWKLAKNALAPATQNDLADLIRDWRDDDPDGVWYAAAHSITDQKVLEDLLVVNDNWIRNFKRDGIMVMTQEKVYYAMYKNITDQELLMKLLDIKEINFRSCDVDSYGHRDRAIFELLDNDHLAKLDKQRDARRKAVKGQTIDFKGFYLGMSRRDKELLLKTEAKGVEKVGGKYGVMGSGPMSDLWFGAEARLKYLGVKKDGLVGLAELVNKYVPGGIDSTGDVQVGGQVDAGYDPENPDVTVKTWWFVNVPQFKCRIRMYDSGSINIYTTDEFDKVELDFSKAGK